MAKPISLVPDPPDEFRLVEPLKPVGYLTAGATFDRTGAYRYTLLRRWARRGGKVTWVMLNPSTADALVLDPTIRRCEGFSRAWGFGELSVVNLFAFRSTDPGALYRHAAGFPHPEPVGPGNDQAILACCRHADLVVAAWGVHGSHLGRGAAVRALLTDAGVALHVLGLTKGGQPKHPLYQRATLRAVPWT